MGGLKRLYMQGIHASNNTHLLISIWKVWAYSMINLPTDTSYGEINAEYDPCAHSKPQPAGRFTGISPRPRQHPSPFVDPPPARVLLRLPSDNRCGHPWIRRSQGESGREKRELRTRLHGKFNACDPPPQAGYHKLERKTPARRQSCIGFPSPDPDHVLRFVIGCPRYPNLTRRFRTV